MKNARLSFLILAFMLTAICAAGEQPNILWITSEDNGPQLGCYGDEYAVTPNIDALAQTSLRYHRCWSNAPVCAPDGTTYANVCYAFKDGWESRCVTEGECD